MAGSRIQVNKAHKTRFASKSSRNVHKVSLKDKHRIAKSEHNLGKGARAARIQRKKMLRDQKRAALLNEKRTLSGSSSPPRVIVLFALSADVDLNSLEKDILTVLSPEGCENYPTVASSEYRIRATVLKAPHGNLQSCIEMAKIADLIAFVVSAHTSGEEIDPFGAQCLSAFRAIGLPSTAVLIRDLPGDLKRRNESKRISSSLASEFPEDCKFFPVDTKDELHKFMWLYKEQRSVIPHWRHQRPYLAAEKIDLVTDESNPGKCTLLLTGYVRAHTFSVNQLVHVSGAGDFQLRQIDLLKDPSPLNPRKGQDLMDADDVNDSLIIHSLVPDNAKQELLVTENVPDPLAGEQTWPTEAEMAEAEKNQNLKRLKKKALPRGTSEYQAAWILDDIDEDDSCSIDDMEDADDGMVLDQGDIDVTHEQGVNDFDFGEDQGSLHLRDSDGETEQDSVMMDGENMTREQLEHEIRKLKEAHAEDQEFPDEVDTPLDIPARKRFAKYRGVKSFRTSSWDPKESLPPEYSRIFAFDNFARTQKHVLAKSLELEQQVKEDECIGVGSYARLHIKEVPELVASQICSNAKMMPIITCGLLQHESKMSVLHFSIKKHDSYTEPIKGKEELVFHVGFRQFIARPIYSSDNISSDKHKMERFLHEGRFCVASIYAPISFPPVPLVALKRVQGSAFAIAAVGSLKRIDPDRIILKKITLTGYPQRVSKYKASVRYMFHNPEDVKWFKPIEVWTKCGRRGRVKEPVGTHGAMKCIFNGVLQQHDTVCMSLYKRAYPKWPEQKFPLSS